MLSPTDFSQLFQEFQASAFRAELLSAYQVPEEAAELAAYCAAGPPPADLGGDTAWRQTLRAGRDAGKRLARVHVVRSPLSDYLRYEFEWGYVFNSRVGEDIRILDLSEADAPPALPPWDFWLFDGQTGVHLHYDEQGAYRGAELVPADHVEQLRHWHVQLTAAAVPFADYWAAHPQYHRRG